MGLQQETTKTVRTIPSWKSIHFVGGLTCGAKTILPQLPYLFFPLHPVVSKKLVLTLTIGTFALTGTSSGEALWVFLRFRIVTLPPKRGFTSLCTHYIFTLGRLVVNENFSTHATLSPVLASSAQPEPAAASPPSFESAIRGKKKTQHHRFVSPNKSTNFS